jgi:hypothetical protein
MAGYMLSPAEAVGLLFVFVLVARALWTRF